MLFPRARGFAKRFAQTRFISSTKAAKGPQEAVPVASETPDLEHKRLGSLWTNVWFPYEPVPVTCQMKPYIVFVKGGHGEVYNYDASGESMTQPWCDGKPRANGVKWDPILYEPRRDGYKLICGCKMSLNGAKCDGTCGVMWADYNPAKACGYIFGAGFVISTTLSYLMHP